MRALGGPACRTRTDGGFTLLELLIAVAIVGIVSAIAGVVYVDVLERARVTKAIAELKVVERLIVQKEIDGEPLPQTLTEIGWTSPDPWGNPYAYLEFATAQPGGGQGESQGVPNGARRDKFLKPLNTSFDLYSPGRDGKSRPSLNAKESHDDVVRAMDGNFMGLGAEF